MKKDKGTKSTVNLKDENITRIVDGMTECCGYNFGLEGYFNRRIMYCPICGRRIISRN